MSAVPLSWRSRDGEPPQVGLDPARLVAGDRAVAAGVRALGDERRTTPDTEGLYAGAVLVVARDGVIVHEAAHGWAATHDGGRLLAAPRAMTAATRFDLASVSKVLGTTAAAMHLVDAGQLDLDAPVRAALPEMPAGEGRDRLTARHLLTHRSGLPPWEPLYLHAREPQAAIARAASRPLSGPPGGERRYSDVGFILLGELCARLAGLPLDALVRERVLDPLGLTATGYLPSRHRVGIPVHTAGIPTRCRSDGVAATAPGDWHERRMIASGDPYPVEGHPDDFDAWRTHTLVGEVSDGNAHHALGGVAGHAGLFGTARDVAAYGWAVVAGARGADLPFAGAAAVRAFVTPDPTTGEALGFWSDPITGARGRSRPPGSLALALSHSGFTGCELLCDPGSGLVVVLLTNRLHPFGPRRRIGAVWDRVLGALVGREA
ncbi:MAG: serine hydrolase [Euzebyales bacterium]|nr:serine hydrolase [Euzebyales bacterium]